MVKNPPDKGDPPLAAAYQSNEAPDSADTVAERLTTPDPVRDPLVTDTTVGEGLTVAFPVAMFWVVAPVEATVMFPLAPFVASLFKRAYIVVDGTVPFDRVSVSVAAYPDPDVREIS